MTTPALLIAMSSQDRGQSLATVAAELGVSSQTFTEVEQLLFHTRTSTPAGIILDDELIARVPQLDLVSLLRNRKHLAYVPLIVIGADKPERHVAVIQSGADLYLAQPLRVALLKVYLRRYLERHRSDAALRDAFTRLRDFETAYKESERIKDDLTHMLVHDLKSPISSVMGLLEHCIDILEATQDEHDLVELLSLARGEARHLLTLAANILDVRRMKEGHMPYTPGLLPNLTEFARAALNDVSGAPREREFSFLVRPEAESIYADTSLLRRIIANLFANAVKHTRRGGHIDFRAWKDGENFVLSVRDDGEGIPLEDQKRIFNAFEQSRHTIHDRYDTGMGLTFCKMAIEKHGGTIWVESKVGQGSTFLFTIPLSVERQVYGEGVTLAGNDT